MLLPGLAAATARSPNVFGHGRGANMASAVWGKRDQPGAPSVYQLQPDRYSPEIIRKIAAAGFDFVRVAVTPVPLMSDDPAARKRALDWLIDKVDGYRAGNLGVVVDLHFWPTDAPMHQDSVMLDPKLRAALIRGQVELARALAGKSRVALELINEPPCNVAGKRFDWPPVQREMVARVRAAAARLPLVLTACRGLAPELLRLDTTVYRRDANIFWTVHYYDPGIFIGQQNYGMRGVPFPPNPALATSKAAIAGMLPPVGAPRRAWIAQQLDQYLRTHGGQAAIGADMAAIAAWARREGVSPNHIFVGEFGTAWSPKFGLDLRDDELRWLRAVRSAAAQQGFAWALWGLPGPGSSHYDPATGLLNVPMQRALGLPARR